MDSSFPPQSRRPAGEGEGEGEGEEEANDRKTDPISDSNNKVKDPKRVIINSSFYMTSDPKLSPQSIALLRDYSHIPEDEMIPHLRRIRETAFAIFPYPCIGLYRFMDLAMHTHPAYPTILSLLRSDPSTTLLDLGCCFGQEIRALVHAGIPPRQLRAADLRPEFWDLGFELFRDRASPLATDVRFYAGDIFDEGPGSALNELERERETDRYRNDDRFGQVDVVYAGAFFHLFSWDQQIRVARRVIRFLRPVAGSMVAGRQLGRKVGGVVQGRDPSSDRRMFRHDPDSWRRLWDEASSQSPDSGKWQVKAEVEYLNEQEKALLGKDGRGIGNVEGDEEATKFTFIVERIP